MELLRLLLEHPQVKVTAITSRTETGAVGDVHPHLRGLTKLAFSSERASTSRARTTCCSSPRRTAFGQGDAGRARRRETVKVVDLSGDFRLADPALYEEHYGKPHAAPRAPGRAVYGAPECGRRAEIAGARLVANPGCHAYASLLAIWPLSAGGPGRRPVSIASVTAARAAAPRPARARTTPSASRLQGLQAAAPPARARDRGRAGGRRAPGLRAAQRALLARHPRTVFVPLRRAARARPRAAFRRPTRRALRAPRARDARAARRRRQQLRRHRGAAEEGLAVVMVAIDNLVKGMAGTACRT
jgi:N-acetyl-gamma-glutamyl-phosphate reductase